MAQTIEAIFYQGDQKRVDHTPVAAVASGVIVDMGNMCGICTSPQGLAANVLGSLDIWGMYKVRKLAADAGAFAAGADVFWDTVLRKAVIAAGANIIRLGGAIEPALAGDDNVKTWVNWDGVQA